MSIAGEEDTFEAEGLDIIPEESDPVFDTGVGEWLHSCTQGTIHMLACGSVQCVVCLYYNCHCIMNVIVWEVKVVQQSPS